MEIKPSHIENNMINVQNINRNLMQNYTSGEEEDFE